MAGQVDNITDNAINKYISQIKNNLSGFNPRVVFDKLKKGHMPHQIAGMSDIGEDYVKELGKAYQKKIDEDIYPKDVLNDKINPETKTVTPGLSKMLGPQDSQQRKDIKATQKRNNPEYFQHEDEGGSNNSEDLDDDEENQDDDEEENKEEDDEEEKEDENEEESEEENPEEKDSSEELENPDDPAEGNGGVEGATETGGEALESAETGGEALAQGGATVAEAATAAETTAAAGGFFAAATPLWIALLIIGILLVLIVIIVPLIKSSGKEGHAPTQPYVNSGNYSAVVSLSKEEELKKLLDQNLDQFVVEIEKIKKNASGDNKDKIVELCDKIIEQAKILNEKTQDGTKADPKEKGEKESAKIKLQSYFKELIVLLYVKTDVVYLNQIEVDGGMASWGCGYTSSAMVAQSYGFNLKPIQIAGDRRSGIPGAGWPAQRLTQLTGVNWKQASSWEDIVKQVNNCNPVIVGTTFSRNSGHWMVIIGFTKSGDVIVNDPYGNHGYNYAGGYVSSGGQTGKAVTYNITDFKAHFNYDGFNGYSAYIVNPPYKLKCK